MTKRWMRLASAAAALLLIFFSQALAKTDFFKIEDLKPGMKGVGRTCVQGSRPEEFQVEILGVLHGVNPGVSMVLARFSGSLLEKTGIFEGMSGSPVFIEGKLLGAVAYSFTFTKEAIGGITPITQMVDAFNESPNPASGKILLKSNMSWKYPLPSSMNPDVAESMAVSSDDVKQQPMLANFKGHSLAPIATPLSLAGFHNETLRMFGPRFRSMGLSLLQGAGGIGSASIGAETKAPENAPLEAGSNIVVPLVRGDLEVSAGGTVTYVDGDRLYAFGHSMLELGFTELPIHKARALMVVPSLESSFKILEIGEQAGTIRQDRGVGIYGILGAKPKMVPLRITLTTSRGTKKEFKFEVVSDPYLTPLLVNATVYNTLVTLERAQGTITLKVQGKIRIKNEQTVEIENGFSSDNDAPNAAALSVAVPVNYLMSPGYGNLEMQEINLDVSAREEDQAALLDSIRLPRTEVKAGESLELEVAYKKMNGDIAQDTYPVTIPANASPGPLMMLVADGSTLMAIDEKEEGENLIPRDLSQLIKFINNLRRNDHLYMRFYRQEPGAIVKGEGLPGLPPSVLAILKSERKVGAVTPIRTSTLMEYEMDGTEYMVSGAKALKLVVIP
ncbi:MAG TPA: SpoIVB peptidase S55 domain-containing protein [Acidobacteriota bacterium]|nr:SpoIVB peptidase S55 domain-containing protein [Acidobacteriota bacterium]